MSRIISSTEVEQASVLINCGDDQGTGFFVGIDVIMTARHVVIDCIDDGELIKINEQEYDATSIIADIIDFDVCLIRLREQTKKYLPINNTSQSFSQPCSVFGFPYSQDVTGNHFLGRIDKLESKKHWDFSFRCSMVEGDIDYSGLSGGAVLSDGQVIGLALIQNGKSIQAISIRKIEAFITENGIEVHQYENPSEVPEQLQEEVKKATPNYAVFEDLTDKLETNSGWFLTYGVPGSGKTTFIASYSPNKENVKVCGRYFAKIPNDYLTTSIRTSDRYFVTWVEDSISTTLGISIDVLPSFEERVKRIPNLFHAIGHKLPETRCVFLMDGLDEIDNLKSILDLIPIDLPTNVSFVLSCTSVDILPTNVKSKLRKETIVEVTPLDIGQCELYLSERLESKNIGIKAIQKIALKSEGHPLYLQYLIKYLLTYDILDEHFDEWIEEIPIIGGVITNYYEILWTKFFSDDCKLWIVLTLSQLRADIDKDALMAMLPEQYRLSFISKFEPIRYLFKGEDTVELYHASFKNFISAKASAYVSLSNSNIVAFCSANSGNQYSIQNLLYHLVLSDKPEESIEFCNQEWADKCSIYHVSPDSIIDDIKRVIKYSVDSVKPIDTIRLLLLLQRIEFRYDSVFAENASLLASALIARGDYSSALKYLLRDNTLLISDRDVVHFLQSFYENNALVEGDKLLSAFETKFRYYLQEVGKSEEGFSMEPFIHRVSALTLSANSVGRDGMLKAMNVIHSLKKVQDSAERDKEDDALASIYRVREIAAAWFAGYMLRRFDVFQSSSERSQMAEIEIDEKWASLTALSILQYQDLNNYATRSIAKSEAYFKTIEDLEWLIDNFGYDSEDGTILKLLKSLIEDSKRLDMVEGLINDYQPNGLNVISSFRDENGVDLNYQLVHAFYFDCVISGYKDSATPYAVNLPKSLLRQQNWEEYYIKLLAQIGILEGVLIKARVNGEDLSSLLASLQAILDASKLSLAERANWDRSYLLPEEILPIIYDRISNLWCSYFAPSVSRLMSYLSSNSDFQLGIYTEGYRHSMSAIIKNMIKWNMPIPESTSAIQMLEKHVLQHVQNRWERTPELLSVMEFYALKGLDEQADLIFMEMLKTSMGPSWYKEAQFQLLNTTLRLDSDEDLVNDYTSKFASLLDYASGEMTFQRYIRYAKESFIGDLASKGRLDIGLEYLKFETIPPFDVLIENAERNKVDSLILGNGNSQGACNLTIQSGILEILSNCDDLNPLLQVALCDIFTLNDDVFRYVDQYSAQMSFALNKIADANQREKVFPIVYELIVADEMKQDSNKYIGALNKNLSPNVYSEFRDYFYSRHEGVKLPESEQPAAAGTSPSALGDAKEDAFHKVNLNFKDGSSQMSKTEVIDLAIDTFKKERISIWLGNWSTSSNLTKEHLKSVFSSPDEAISSLSPFINDYGVETWTVVDRLLWFFEHNLTKEQAQLLFKSISDHFELLIRPEDYVFEKYNWINTPKSEKTANDQVIGLIAWLTTHPLSWISLKAQSCLIFLCKNLPDLTVPALIAESTLVEPSRKGEFSAMAILELVKESPETLSSLLSRKPHLTDKIAEVSHLTIFKTYVDIGKILLENGSDKLDKALQAQLPDVIEWNSEVALEESMLEPIQSQIDLLNEFEVLNRKFCEDILKSVSDTCSSLTWQEVVKSDRYLRRSYHEEKSYQGRYPELVNYALNTSIMTRAGKNNLEQLYNAINPN